MKNSWQCDQFSISSYTGTEIEYYFDVPQTSLTQSWGNNVDLLFLLKVLNVQIYYTTLDYYEKKKDWATFYIVGT